MPAMTFRNNKARSKPAHDTFGNSRLKNFLKVGFKELFCLLKQKIKWDRNWSDCTQNINLSKNFVLFNHVAFRRVLLKTKVL